MISYILLEEKVARPRIYVQYDMISSYPTVDGFRSLWICGKRTNQLILHSCYDTVIYKYDICRILPEFSRSCSHMIYCNI